MMWGQCMFYWNGRPPAMGGSRGHHGGRPRCGDKDPFGLWVLMVSHVVYYFIAPHFWGGMLKPTTPKKAGATYFCHNYTMPPPHPNRKRLDLGGV
jgi:hypothetical protein